MRRRISGVWLKKQSLSDLNRKKANSCIGKEVIIRICP